MAAALFRHIASRNLDPQLHTHAVVANMTRDGRGPLEERRADRAAPERHIVRGLLPGPAGAAPDCEGLLDPAGDGGAHAELRDRGLRPAHPG